MQDESSFDPQLVGLATPDWLTQIVSLSNDHGVFNALGKRHFATRIDGNETLLVSFETTQGIRALSPKARPFGWEMRRDFGWSSLCLACNGDTWFRNRAVYAFFDLLTDKGTFDAFETVIFYGAGPCAYAAAAFSVACPGARVLAIQPQATLDPRVTEWDHRFSDMRRTDFTDRYGYAPDMLDAAHSAYVLYDPNETLDAMHAALFTRPNVTKFRLRYLGDAIQTHFLTMNLLPKLLADIAVDQLDTKRFATLWRQRREYPPYLRALLAALDSNQRNKLSKVLCKNVSSRLEAPRFARRLSELQSRTP